MENVLWPYLMELLIPRQYAGAVPTVCRCLGHIALKKRAENSPELAIDWQRAVNLPRPQGIMARLLVASCETAGAQPILRSLAAMGPALHPR